MFVFRSYSVSALTPGIAKATFSKRRLGSALPFAFQGLSGAVTGAQNLREHSKRTRVAPGQNDSFHPEAFFKRSLEGLRLISNVGMEHLS
jgi:hypothetical protein